MSSKLHEFETLFDRVLNEIIEEEEKVQTLLQVFNDLVISLSEASSLHFNTLFARVSYITTRYKLPRPWAYALQIVRRELKQRNLSNRDLLPIVLAADQFLLAILQTELDEEDGHTLTAPRLPKLPEVKRAGRYKKKYARVMVVEADLPNKLLTIIDEEEPGTTCILHYSEDVNEIFADTLELAIRELGLPLILGLSDIETTEENHYIPGFIVIMPDLLMDVTTVSTTKASGPDPLAVNVIDQFLPSGSTESILVGQVANYFLDQLVTDSSLAYEEIFRRTFKIYPIEFVQLSDDQLKAKHIRMRAHFDHIKFVIDEKFPLEGIVPSECIIEPSYFSPQYGIKGRLDLYYQHESEQAASIVELKSGKPFKPNSYGLNSEHYHQTLLYELLIKSVHGPGHHRMNYILYSTDAAKPLRYAVSVESIQKETIQNRNLQVLLLFRLLNLDQPEARNVLDEIDPEKLESFQGFIKNDIQTWHKIYSTLSPGEKEYLKYFTAYITREHMLARIGNESGDGSGGLAGLWLNPVDIKENRYQLLRSLDLVDVDKSNFQTLITFRKSEITNPLANFRAGDIAIMYPFDPENEDPTKYQLHRATILHIDHEQVVIRLRNHQVHTDRIESVSKWNIEHDVLDSSFRALYQSLWHFISADVVQRQLIYGLLPPKKVDKLQLPVPTGLTSTQIGLYKEGIEAEKLYLLWGPPGTGKTSRLLKNWVWYYYFHTNARIALLAYTNRAVDEICEAIHDLGEEVANHYLRIGSRAGTGAAFRHRLLDNVIDPFQRRSEIKNLLDNTRIFTATVASLQGKNEIFKLIDFEVALIDEASQILEPAMVGLLPHFGKTILIGDHMQLPAVSAQSHHYTKLREQPNWAQRIRLTDLSMSYFERMYRLYQSKGWDHAIGVLSEQGRMHADVQAFANQYVYNNKLSCLHPAEQFASLRDATRESDDPLFTGRLIYMPSNVSILETYQKTNRHEAHCIIDTLVKWKNKILEEQLGWTIGIITPFRAQIAAIQHLAHQTGIDLEGVTVDTVERYQGGARDIILMSCAVNNSNYLNKIVSINEDSIDRKLNVAVTRARQQFVFTGNEDILINEPSYAKLISMSTKVWIESNVIKEDIVH